MIPNVLTDAGGLTSPIGLVAGSGSYPVEFAESARSKGLEVIAVAHVGESDRRIEKLARHCEWVRVGELNKMIATFKSHGVKQVAMAGGISRVKIFGGIRPDMRSLALLARIRSVKDDILLRGITEEFESEGMSVVSASVLMADSVATAGYLTRRKFSADELNDAKIGWEAAKGLGTLDIGQTAIVSQGMVVALECVEGTDRTILRAGDLAGPGCTVVKLAKPQQDLRLDLPAIGIRTIETMRKAKATALLVEAGRCLVLGREELVHAADRADISVLAIPSLHDLTKFQGGDL